jgi:non-ribosomal peptide synthase protein (TIGR01720 family)
MGYGLLRFGGAATETARALAAAPGAPVSFNYLGQFPGGGPSGEAPGPRVRLAAGPLGAERSPRAHRTHRLEVNAFVAGGRLRVAFGFSGSIHRRATVEKLSERTAQELKDLAAGRDEEEAARALAPSDFPLAELEEETFRRLATLLEDAG